MVKIKKDTMPKGAKWARRQQIWRHNSFFGCAAMMKMQSLSISESETTTAESKVLANQIYELATKLSASLKTRATP